uniref:Putative secreted protein n=1 Tax=Anopheles darlingi TaxID=43151 RepID=A0A2M4D6M8_ANODA
MFYALKFGFVFRRVIFLLFSAFQYSRYSSGKHFSTSIIYRLAATKYHHFQTVTSISKLCVANAKRVRESGKRWERVEIGWHAVLRRIPSPAAISRRV